MFINNKMCSFKTECILHPHCLTLRRQEKKTRLKSCFHPYVLPRTPGDRLVSGQEVCEKFCVHVQNGKRRSSAFCTAFHTEPKNTTLKMCALCSHPHGPALPFTPLCMQRTKYKMKMLTPMSILSLLLNFT